MSLDFPYQAHLQSSRSFEDGNLKVPVVAHMQIFAFPPLFVGGMFKMATLLLLILLTHRDEFVGTTHDTSDERRWELFEGLRAIIGISEIPCPQVGLYQGLPDDSIMWNHIPCHPDRIAQAQVFFEGMNAAPPRYLIVHGAPEGWYGAKVRKDVHVQVSEKALFRKGCDIVSVNWFSQFIGLIRRLELLYI